MHDLEALRTRLTDGVAQIVHDLESVGCTAGQPMSVADCHKTVAKLCEIACGVNRLSVVASELYALTYKTAFQSNRD